MESGRADIFARKSWQNRSRFVLNDFRVINTLACRVKALADKNEPFTIKVLIYKSKKQKKGK